MAKNEELDFAEGQELDDPRDLLDDDDDDQHEDASIVVDSDDDDDDYDDEGGIFDDDDEDDDDADDDEAGVDDDDDDDGDEDDDQPRGKSRSKRAKRGGRKGSKAASEATDEDEGDDFDPLAGVNLNQNVEPSIKKAVESLGGAVKGLSKKLAQKEEELSRERAQRTVDQFDAMVQKAGHTEVFGKGPAGKLPKGSKHLENRQKLLNAVNRVIAGYRATGDTIPTLEEAFDEAMAVSVGLPASKQKPKTDRNDERARQIRKRQRVNVTRTPSRSAGRATSVDQDGKNFIRNFLRDNRL